MVSKHEFKKKCYNCDEMGYLPSVCLKPKKQCTNYKLLSHLACRRAVSSVKTIVDVCDGQSKTKKDNSDCYYVKCKVNGQLFNR